MDYTQRSGRERTEAESEFERNSSGAKGSTVDNSELMPPDSFSTRSCPARLECSILAGLEAYEVRRPARRRAKSQPYE